MTLDAIPTMGTRLRLLYVAYPLLPVSEQSAGGAEQVLWTLEREMHARAHETTVAACAGSQFAGNLFPTGDAASGLDESEARSRQQTRVLIEWLNSSAESQFDLLHDMSGGFWQHAARIRLPVLATLHLARSLYKDIDFARLPSNLLFTCVSQKQTLEFKDVADRVLGVVPNGIALDRFPPEPARREEREYLLWLGRICEEKGTHTALDIAHAAGKKLIVGGAVYPFLYHQKYFAREVIPRLKRAGSMAKYVERPAFAEKIDLLCNAQALLITSNINETSSMVAMEAAACGTPVVALGRGALPEVVAEGITGFVAQSTDEMISALRHIGDIDAKRCRRYAEENYSAQRMADRYEGLYRRLFTSEKTQTARH